MFGRNLWALAVAASWVLLGFLHFQASRMAETAPHGAELFRWFYTGGYLVLGGLLLAALMRLMPALSPSLGRAAIVLGGAVLDGIEAYFVVPPAGSTRFDIWMAGLLGLALAALAARLVPEPVARAWMGRREVDFRP